MALRKGLQMKTRVVEQEVAHVPVAWPVSWSAIWVGALAALAVALLISLAGLALGAQIVGPGERIANWHRVNFGGIVWAICGAFFSFVVGGWVAARIGGFVRSEPAMLHGAISWLIAIPLLLLFAALGSGGYFGTLYTGLAGTPAWVQAPPIDADGYAILRNNALGTITALILGLIGSVLGGWMGSGEPMTFLHYFQREETATPR
jgi:hypothetical protein